MTVVDMYADFIGGLGQYEAEDLEELKQKVAERLARNDINWGMYRFLVNDREINPDSSYQFQPGDVIKVISPGIKGGV